VLASVSASSIREQLVKVIRDCQPHATLTPLTSLPELNGLKNGYRDFTRLGVDRWLTFMAVTPLSDKDYIIIDAGSAITIDLLSRSKGHLGGAILPGFNTHEERFRAMFPLADFDNGVTYRSIEHPGHDTESCIDISQAPFSINGVISIVHRWLDLLHQPCEVLLCGQDAELIRQGLEIEGRILPDLVFRGMLKQIQLQG
jgi:type III pantothenate kinase